MALVIAALPAGCAEEQPTVLLAASCGELAMLTAQAVLADPFAYGTDLGRQPITSLPDSVRSEVSRLNPSNIVLRCDLDQLETDVARRVLSQLDSLDTDTPEQTQRVAVIVRLSAALREFGNILPFTQLPPGGAPRPGPPGFPPGLPGAPRPGPPGFPPGLPGAPRPGPAGLAADLPAPL